jgi:protein TonB
VLVPRSSKPKAPTSAAPTSGGAATLPGPRVFRAAGTPSTSPAVTARPRAEPAAAAATRNARAPSKSAHSRWDFANLTRRLSDMQADSSLILYAFAASFAIHAVLLAIKFQVFDPRTLADRSPKLEVALVNAKSASKPTKADVLAQANLDGGGNTDADRRAKTPLPLPPRDTLSNDLALTTQKAEALERRAQELMSQLKSGAPVAPVMPPPRDALDVPQVPTATDMTQRTLEVMRLEAQIARDLDAYQKRPKRQVIGARASEYRFARYVEDWRQKVERMGNLNYPEAARQFGMYGSLILTVAIRADGSIERIVVERSSGQRVLDAAATKIVEMAAPYSPFPPDIRRDTEILEITRTWTFAKGDELRSE